MALRSGSRVNVRQTLFGFQTKFSRGCMEEQPVEVNLNSSSRCQLLVTGILILVSRELSFDEHSPNSKNRSFHVLERYIPTSELPTTILSIAGPFLLEHGYSSLTCCELRTHVLMIQQNTTTS